AHRCAARSPRRRRDGDERAGRRRHRRHPAKAPAPPAAQGAPARARHLAGREARLRPHGRRRGGGLRVRVRLLRLLHGPRAAPARPGEGVVRRTRILIADSLPIFRSGVRNLLARESDFEVVESSTFDELVREVATDCPDIALVDLELPPRGGVTAVSYLAERCSAHTIVWSFEPSRETV